MTIRTFRDEYFQLLRHNEEDNIFPFITMKYLSDKQEEYKDNIGDFNNKYGFIFRDYEIFTNIAKKVENNDDTYMSDIKSSIIALKNSQNIYVKEIYDSVDEDKLKEEVLQDVIPIINKTEYLKKHFIELSKDYNDRIFQIGYIDQEMINNLMIKLATHNHQTKTYYNPSCKNASILTQLKGYNKAVVNEADKNAYLQALQNLIINEAPLEKITITNMDNPDDKTKYDTIISSPSLKKQRRLEHKPDRNPYLTYLKNLYEHLSDDGILVTDSRQIVLQSRDSEDFRKTLIDNNYLDTVISLPAPRNMEKIILVINRDKKDDKVLFIYPKEHLGNYGDLFETILDCYQKREKERGLSNLLTNNNLIENEYKIIPKRYVYTLDYEKKNIEDIIMEQEECTKNIRQLDEEIEELLKELPE